jgi:hypothetical protein
MTEILLQAAYMNKDPQVRATQFFDHVQASKMKMVKRRRAGETKRDQAGQNPLKRVSDDILAKLPNLNIGDPAKLYDHWWKGPVTDLADAWVDDEDGGPFLDDYYSSYSADSHYVHSSPLVMEDYIRVKNRSVEILRESPLKYEVDLVIIVSRRFLLLAGQFAEAWSAPIAQEIIAAIHRAGNLAADRARLLRAQSPGG